MSTPSDHRGRPTNGNHRPTPRLAQLLATLKTQEHKDFYGPDTPETSPAGAQRYIDYYRTLKNAKETYGGLPTYDNHNLAMMQENISRSIKTRQEGN